MTMSSVKRLLMILIVAGGCAYAAQGDIGGFDIEKVRKAARRNDSVQEIKTAAAPAAERESAATLVLRITISLGIVAVLLVSVAWFIRKSGLKNLHGSGAMDIIEMLPTGQNRTLLLVRVMDEIYLISQTASSITLIDKISGQKALDIIASSHGGSTIVGFREAFNNFMGKIRKPS